MSANAPRPAYNTVNMHNDHHTRAGIHPPFLNQILAHRQFVSNLLVALCGDLRFDSDARHLGYNDHHLLTGRGDIGLGMFQLMLQQQEV